MQGQTFSTSPRGSLSKTEGSLLPSQHHLTKGGQLNHHLFWISVSPSVTWFLHVFPKGEITQDYPFWVKHCAGNTCILCPMSKTPWALCYPLVRKPPAQHLVAILSPSLGDRHAACPRDPKNSRNKTTAIQKKHN